MLARPPTLASALSVAGAKLEGLEQHLAGHAPLKPNKLTMQQYNDRVAVMVQKEGADTVSLLKAYPVGGGPSAAAAVAAWKAWAATGSFPADGGAHDDDAGDDETNLYEPEGGKGEMASVVSLRTTVAAGAKSIVYLLRRIEHWLMALCTHAYNGSGKTRTVRFILAWHAQEVTTAGRTDNRTVCGTTDNNRMYHNRFGGAKGLENLLTYAAQPTVREQLEQVCIF